jgi:hypothetical protein
MNSDQPCYIWKGEVPSELLYGVNILLEHGDVDRTHCPGQRVSAEEIGDTAMSNGETSDLATRDGIQGNTQQNSGPSLG